jgi:hypothetical protein
MSLGSPAETIGRTTLLIDANGGKRPFPRSLIVPCIPACPAGGSPLLAAWDSRRSVYSAALVLASSLSLATQITLWYANVMGG